MRSLSLVYVLAFLIHAGTAGPSGSSLDGIEAKYNSEIGAEFKSEAKAKLPIVKAAEQELREQAQAAKKEKQSKIQEVKQAKKEEAQEEKEKVLKAKKEKTSKVQEAEQEEKAKALEQKKEASDKAKKAKAVAEDTYKKDKKKNEKAFKEQKKKQKKKVSTNVLYDMDHRQVSNPGTVPTLHGIQICGAIAGLAILGAIISMVFKYTKRTLAARNDSRMLERVPCEEDGHEKESTRSRLNQTEQDMLLVDKPCIPE